MRVTNVARAVVHVQRAAARARAGALRVVDLDAAAVVLLAGLEGLVEGGAGGGAVRGGRRDVDEREERVDEGSSVFDACELGKAEALGGTLCK